MTDQKALIYCRVSDVKQTTRGDGLASQETRCREYARARGYGVVATFKDDKSGSLIDRPGMQDMLAYLRKHRSDQLVVIIDDISRLARGIHAHWKLRTSIAKAGGMLESPSVTFGEDADSEMQEYILATIAQHQRRKNAEQTKNRMQARVMNGYWVFQAPRGYKYEAKPGQGRVLVPNGQLASIVRAALEGFASGRFGSQMDVVRYLESEPAYPKDKATGGVPQQRVSNMLSQPLYAGYIEYPEWGVTFRKARHEPLISLEAFERIQERLKEGARLPYRADLSAEFPLRGFVACSCCGKGMTAYFAKSKTGKRYAYYECYNKTCERRRKAISAKKMEAAFEAILKRLQPAPETAALLKDILAHVWERREGQAREGRKALEADIRKLDGEIDKLLERMVEITVPSALGAFERKIAELEKRKLVLEEKLSGEGLQRHTYEDSFELAIRFLSTPWNIWQNGSLKARRLLLKLVFAEPLPYCREKGFRTPTKSLPFNALEAFSGGKMEVARPGGFEPPTS